MKRRHRGFTLIELLVVVAMISIMLAIAVPSFRSFISNYRVTSAVNDFLQGIAVTRNEALKRGRRVVMMPNDSTGTPSVTGNWKYGWTVFVDVNNNNVLDSAEISGGNLVFKHEALPTAITLTAPQSATSVPFTDGTSKTYVSYDGTGYARTLAGASIGTGQRGIVMTDTTNIRTLCMGILGRTRILKGLDTASCANG